MRTISVQDYIDLEARVAALEAQLATLCAAPPAPEAVLTKDEVLKRVLLAELAAAKAAGIDTVQRKWLAILARRSPRSSDVDTLISALAREGYVIFPGTKLVKLTDKPRSWESAPVVPLTFETLIRRLFEGVLDTADANILKHLAFQWPPARWITRSELAAAVGQSAESSTFKARLAGLGKLGLIENRAGAVLASLHWFTAFPVKKGRVA